MARLEWSAAAPERSELRGRVDDRLLAPVSGMARKSKLPIFLY
jgi:hypothetical protein